MSEKDRSASALLIVWVHDALLFFCREGKSMGCLWRSAALSRRIPMVSGIPHNSKAAMTSRSIIFLNAVGCNRLRSLSRIERELYA